MLATCHLIIASMSATLVAGGPTSSASGALGAPGHAPDGVDSPAHDPRRLLLTALRALRQLAGAPRPVLAGGDLQDLVSLLQGTLEGVIGPALLQAQHSSLPGRSDSGSGSGSQDMAAHLAVCCSILQSVAASSHSTSSDNKVDTLDELIARAALTAISIAMEVTDGNSSSAKGGTGRSGAPEAEEQLAGAAAAAFAAARCACARSGALAAPLVFAALWVLRTCRAGAIPAICMDPCFMIFRKNRVPL